MPSILVVLSSHEQLGNTGKTTGWYLPEFAHPYDKFVEAGWTVDVASPKGGKAPLDPSSVEAFSADPSSKAFLAKPEIWSSTTPLSEIASSLDAAKATASKYDALFYPGGHGPMFDLANDKQSHYLIAAFTAAGKVVSAVCHGPAALANARVNPDDASSAYVVAGKKVSGFTDAEEAEVQLTSVVPFLLETRLRENGAVVETGANWSEKVVVDGTLVTGQNPASAGAVGTAIVAAVSK